MFLLFIFLYLIAEVLQGVDLWKKVTFFVALPGCLLASIYCINGHLEHEKHSHRPEFIPYEHLRIRTRVCVYLNIISLEIRQLSYGIKK